jgi:alpha-galactosidase
MNQATTPVLLVTTLALLAGLALSDGARAVETPLSDLDLSGLKQGWGQPRADAAVDGPALCVAGQTFESGIGTHAPSSWKLSLQG